MYKELLTLGIDTSFDETSVSVVRGFSVLSNIQPSQMQYHKKFGGVVPSLAKLAHQERIDNVVLEALKVAKVNAEDLDAIAVTYGPGLAMALEIGINKAKDLVKQYKKPLVIIDHMEGHILSSFAERNSNLKSSFNITKQKFPTLGFLISGGHTELILVNDFGEYTKIGETLDDSCGEAYDKCGRMIGLGYPAGPVISEFSKQHRKDMTIKVVKINGKTLIKGINKKTKAEYFLPISMVNSGDLNFSYSGLKTAFKYLIEELSGKKFSHEDELKESSTLTKEQIYDLCVVFEAAALGQLTIKLKRAIEKYKPTELWLGGGVIASVKLRSEMRKVCKPFNINVKYPYSKKLTGDNAAMIAIAANLKLLRFSDFSHNPQNGIYLKDFDFIDRNPTLSL